ncbi:uncharacterized protein PV07_08428 [Cladophialophora immunda]|uniref:Uncharacterized protein n=1 Tax=Cladophialophora immunda TaxID=569365 RepID=A0A0D2AJY5_9EURO|nr:uncharacterized protein PV07_08428 [Cladophialophora immunda]KIW25232.1 hypothetical protein PV07_08428 [Cladophialophora immunda]
MDVFIPEIEENTALASAKLNYNVWKTRRIQHERAWTLLAGCTTRSLPGSAQPLVQLLSKVEKLPRKLCIFDRGRFLNLAGYHLFNEISQGGTLPLEQSRTDQVRRFRAELEKQPEPLRASVLWPFIECVIEWYGLLEVHPFLQALYGGRELIVPSIYQFSQETELAEAISTLVSRSQINPNTMYTVAQQESVPVAHKTALEQVLGEIVADRKRCRRVFRVAADKTQFVLWPVLLWLFMMCHPSFKRDYVRELTSMIGVRQGSYRAEYRVLREILAFLRHRAEEFLSTNFICPYWLPLHCATCEFSDKARQAAFAHVDRTHGKQFGLWYRSQEKEHKVTGETRSMEVQIQAPWALGEQAD